MYILNNMIWFLVNRNGIIILVRITSLYFTFTLFILLKSFDFIKKMILFRLPSDLIAFVYIPLYNAIETLNIKKVDVQFRSSVPPKKLGNKSEYNGSSEMTSKSDGPCHSRCRTPIPEHTWSKFLKLCANPNYILYNYIFRASHLISTFNIKNIKFSVDYIFFNWFLA